MACASLLCAPVPTPVPQLWGEARLTEAAHHSEVWGSSLMGSSPGQNGSSFPLVVARGAAAHVAQRGTNSKELEKISIIKYSDCQSVTQSQKE